MLDKTLHLYLSGGTLITSLNEANFHFSEMVIFEMVFYLLTLCILKRDVKY